MPWFLFTDYNQTCSDNSDQKVEHKDVKKCGIWRGKKNKNEFNVDKVCVDEVARIVIEINAFKEKLGICARYYGRHLKDNILFIEMFVLCVKMQAYLKNFSLERKVPDRRVPR